ncbi:fibronectin type III domain-containing protein [Alkalihalobacillus sp. NPDC078783]
MPITYNVYRNGEQIATGLSVTTYTDTGLNPSENYTYQVTAVNDIGESELSEGLVVETEAVVEPEPVPTPEPEIPEENTPIEEDELDESEVLDETDSEQVIPLEEFPIDEPVSESDED